MDQSIRLVMLSDFKHRLEETTPPRFSELLNNRGVVT
jgi:hypothetical protein